MTRAQRSGERRALERHRGTFSGAKSDRAKPAPAEAARSACREPEYVITDNAMRARLDFPDCRIVSQVEQLWHLPEACKVAVVQYAVGTLRHNAITAAEALAKKGHVEIMDPERPFE